MSSHISDKNCVISQDKTEEPFRAVLPWVLFISLMFLINYLTRTFFGPLLPYMEKEFGISHSISTGFLLSLSIGTSIGMLFSGVLCSLLSPRVLVGLSILLGGVVFQGIAVADTVWLMFILFAVFGVSAGQYLNAGLCAMRGLVRSEQWGKAVSVHELGPNVGFILAPIIARAGAAYIGWRGTVAGLGVAAIVGGGAFLLAGKGEARCQPRVTLNGFACLLGMRQLWIITWLMGVAIACQFGPFSVLTLHMTSERFMAHDLSAFLLSMSRLPTPLGALFSAYVCSRIGTGKTLAVASLLCAASLAIMSVSLPIPFLVGMFAQPFFTAMIFPILFVLMAEQFSAGEQSALLSLVMPIASFFGLGIMPVVLGVFGDHLGFATGFLALSGITLFNLVLLRLLPKKEKV